ncbi:unnamed protein product [Rhodiola kirilowii]
MESKVAAFGGFLAVLLLSSQVLTLQPTSNPPANNGSEEMVPVMDEHSVKMMELQGMFNLSSNNGRRKLGSFQLCSVCTCCGGITRICISSPCCYSINCNIPNRPFGQLRAHKVVESWGRGNEAPLATTLPQFW